MEELLITCPKFGRMFQLLSALRFAVEDNTGRPYHRLHVVSRAATPHKVSLGQISLEVTNRLKKAAAG
jgi:hypothetical protein